jgi:hypothetical protein
MKTHKRVYVQSFIEFSKPSYTLLAGLNSGVEFKSSELNEVVIKELLDLSLIEVGNGDNVKLTPLGCFVMNNQLCRLDYCPDEDSISIKE